MATAQPTADWFNIDTSEYKRRIRAWTMYDWANSAFATTILAAVLPVYYSKVAGATLPSEATATAYWSLGLSASLLITAVLAPILGTISDITRAKKRFLGLFAGLGVMGTSLLVLVDTGDWLLASLAFIVARVGFGSANVFYDSLLPHVAREEERDRVSTRGYALGYLGGGLLLAINAGMIELLPGTWGTRLSFLSVAIWWVAFSIPIFRRVPEPPAAGARLAEGENVVRVTLRHLRRRLRDIRQYRELFKYLVAFLIYNDGIGTIIGVGAIYGAELGFGTLELVLALLLIQFAGIPFSLIFGRLPNAAEKRRPDFLAFIIFSLVVTPLAGILTVRLLPGEITGAPLPPYLPADTAAGEGVYLADDGALRYAGEWERSIVPAEELSAGPISALFGGQVESVLYASTDQPGARYDFAFNGEEVELTYSSGPDRGIWAVEVDGRPLLDQDTGEPLTVDGYSPTVRYGVRRVFRAGEPGEHVLSLVNTGRRNPESRGNLMTLAQLEVLPPARQSNLGAIFGLIIGLEAVGAVFALALGRTLFSRLARTLDTKRSIALSLVVFAVIAAWGFVLDSVIEFWFLSWMVAIVLGGSQALSRSLYASMSPAAKSGEFFGLYSVMSKFSAIIGPVLFAIVAGTFGNSRPAVLSLIVIFVAGGFLLMGVDVAEGQRVAHEEDAALLGAAAQTGDIP